MNAKKLLEFRHARDMEALKRQRNILKSRSTGIFDVPGVARASLTSTQESNSDLMNTSTGEEDTCAEQDNGSLLDHLTSADAQYAERLAKLQKFKNKSKSITKSNSARSEWMKEHKLLHSTSAHIEADCSSLIEVLLLHAAGTTTVESASASAPVDEGSDHAIAASDSVTEDRIDADDRAGYAVMSMMEAFREQRQHSQRLLMRQLGEIKDLWALTKTFRAGNGQDKDGDERNAQIKNANAIFADLLVQTKSSMNQQWADLRTEEESLWSEIQGDHAMLREMLRADRQTQQNIALERGLAAQDDDDAEVLLHMEEWYSRLAALDLAHGQELQLLVKQKQEDLTEYHLLAKETIEDADGISEVKIDAEPAINEGGESAAEQGAPTAGTMTQFPKPWTPELHMVFTKLMRNAQKTGQSRSKLEAQFHIQLPSIKPDQMRLHEEWYRKHRLVAERRRVCMQNYDTTRNKLVEDAKKALESFRAARKAALQAEAENESREIARKVLHRQLEQLRIAKMELQAKLDAECQAKSDADAEVEAAAKAAADRRAEWNKAQVALFRETKAALLRAQEEEEARRIAAAEALRKATIDANRPKVDARKALLDEKEARRRTAEIKAHQREQKKLEYLMELASQVPYYEAVQSATAKLDHLTAAVISQEYLGYEEEARGHTKATGFADKKVIASARFRLANALRDAGLANTGAAKLAVQNAFQRPQLAIHGVLSHTGGAGFF